ncbi:MAG: O-succinylhomoserine sulfhydrylase [Alphaproteobacteria bacterium GM202ARS2]|nr:O-succinylhomoserine sulfhydrylase [Alphaproteobacteria bacterium GM202ARS2]
MDKKKKQQTFAVHGGQQRSAFMETSEALYLTSGYVYDKAAEAAAAFRGDNEHYIYSRFSNPTVTMFEEKMAGIGGSEACWATATGMAAVFASLMCQLRAGQRVVASRTLFGSCDYIIRMLLPRFGIESVLVDGDDRDGWQQAFAQGVDVVFLETPSNPTLGIIDMDWVCGEAHKHGACVIVDNVFATPVLQNPFQWGADIVVYSATKHIDGQGRCLGGAVLGTKAFCQDVLKPFIRNTGPSLSPFNAWVLLKGLETLRLRVMKQSESALAVARYLEESPMVARVFYPYLESHPQHGLAVKQMSAGGTMISFELVDGTQEKAFAFLDSLTCFRISNNLGDSRSLAVHPATTTHHRLTVEERAAAGISEHLVRLSVGLEDEQDILADVAQALAGVASTARMV